MLVQLGALVVVGTSSRSDERAQAKIPITVYKDPNCGCCALWVEHLSRTGFAVTVKDSADVDTVKRAHDVPQPLWSCHTALAGGYVIEGHVPAADVKALLARKPKGIVGLTIPGMPASAPGMDLKPFRPYTVLAFDKTGQTSIFAKHDRPL
jgi:hypothetical protein